MAALPLRSTASPGPRPGRAPTSPATRRPATTRHLRAVPARRRTAGLVLVASVVLAILMLGAAVLNTTLAERQLQVDELEQRVDEASTRFEVLRGQRAELRSPGRLSGEAAALGMYPTSSGMFVRVDPHTYAVVLAAFGSVDDANRVVQDVQPLDQFRKVKRAAGADL